MKQLTLPTFGFTFNESTIAHDTEAAVFIPEVWANKILQNIFASSALISSVSRDYEDEVAEQGDTIHIQKFGELTAADKVAQTKVTWQNPTATQADITLDFHKIVPFMVESRALSVGQGFADGYIMEAVRAIVNDIESNLAGQWVLADTDVTFDPTSEATKLQSLIDARTAITVTGECPMDVPKYMVIKDQGELLNVTKFTSTDYAEGKPLVQGHVGNILDFNVKESSKIKTLSGQVKRMVLAREAIVLATRPLAAPAAKSVDSAVVNSNGISVRVVRSWSAEDVSDVVTVDVLYGFKVIRPEWLVNLTD